VASSSVMLTSSALKTLAAASSEASVPIYQTPRCHIPEDLIHNTSGEADRTEVAKLIYS
jgi:hypothetical protein